MVTPKELVRHELIGLDVEVLASSDPSMVGLRGKVSDESRNMLTIDTPLGSRAVVKEQCTFRFTLPGGENVRVKGSLIVGRPEDRIRKKTRKW